MSHSSAPTVPFVWAQFTIYQCEWKFLCSSLSLCCFWRLMDWPQLKSYWLCVECSVCLWHVKVFQNRLFSRRLGQQAAVTVKGLSLFFWTGGHSPFVWVCCEFCESIAVFISSSVYSRRARCLCDFVKDEWWEVGTLEPQTLTRQLSHRMTHQPSDYTEPVCTL